MSALKKTKDGRVPSEAFTGRIKEGWVGKNCPGGKRCQKEDSEYTEDNTSPRH